MGSCSTVWLSKGTIKKLIKKDNSKA